MPVRRVSQGSGVMMLTDVEIAEMAQLGSTHGVEVSLFLGPRGAWDTGGQSIASAAVGGVARGAAGIEWCVAEVRRAAGLGIRSFLVAMLGVLATLGAMKRAGELPEDLLVLLPCANPETARVLEGLGAGTINVSTDLSAAELGELRGACITPLDVYVEVPDDQVGSRWTEVPELIRRAAPIYVKLGLRNAPNIYPSGLHLADVAVKLGRERVRRAELVLRLAGRTSPRARRGQGCRHAVGSRDSEALAPPPHGCRSRASADRAHRCERFGQQPRQLPGPGLREHRVVIARQLVTSTLLLWRARASRRMGRASTSRSPPRTRKRVTRPGKRLRDIVSESVLGSHGARPRRRGARLPGRRPARPGIHDASRSYRYGVTRLLLWRRYRDPSRALIVRTRARWSYTSGKKPCERR